MCGYNNGGAHITQGMRNGIVVCYHKRTVEVDLINYWIWSACSDVKRGSGGGKLGDLLGVLFLFLCGRVMKRDFEYCLFFRGESARGRRYNGGE